MKVQTLTVREKKRKRRNNLIAYSFIAPNFIGFAVFTLIPIVVAFYMAFCEWDGNNPAKFTGFDNFLNLGEVENGFLRIDSR